MSSYAVCEIVVHCLSSNGEAGRDPVAVWTTRCHPALPPGVLCYIHGLLMYGVDGNNSVDIPAGDVLSLTKEATLSTQTQKIAVGSDYFKSNNSEVFSR